MLFLDSAKVKKCTEPLFKMFSRPRNKQNKSGYFFLKHPVCIFFSPWPTNDKIKGTLLLQLLKLFLSQAEILAVSHQDAGTYSTSLASKEVMPKSRFLANEYKNGGIYSISCALNDERNIKVYQKTYYGYTPFQTQLPNLGPPNSHLDFASGAALQAASKYR